MTKKQTGFGALWLFTGLLAVTVLGGVGFYLLYDSLLTSASGAELDNASGQSTAPTVQVVRPQVGGLERTSDEPGTVQAFESADLYAEVPGYLVKQTVDIGDRVTKGQVLAEIDVPELVKQVEGHRAAVAQAHANVEVMEARVQTAVADLDVAKATVVKSEATAKSAKAMRLYREKQLTRMQDLFNRHSIEERIVEETQEQTEAAVEAERAARAAIVAAQAQVVAQTARIRQAEADVTNAKAAVQVADAELQKAEVMVQFAAIKSPYDGVVTRRNFFRGEFIRAATAGNSSAPLLTVARTDHMRVIVQIPDRDVPFLTKDADAYVELDALPKTHIKPLKAKVSRTAHAEDPQTRLMRAEIDLPNPDGHISQGMYGKVRIVLEHSPTCLSLPSSCLVDKAESGKAAVFIVRDGRAHLTPVVAGWDDGVRTVVVAGIRADDDVILNPKSSLKDDVPVTPAANEK